MTDLYDKDTYGWAQQQAEALRRRSANEVDWENIAEEIESVGKTEARDLYSRYVVLLTHLLKWCFQSERRSASWEITINTQRELLRRHLDKNPSLKPRRDELIGEAYFEARAEAALQTGLDIATFPETNPFIVSQAMNDAFWPEPPVTK
jgi:hypothetical protein